MPVSFLSTTRRKRYGRCPDPLSEVIAPFPQIDTVAAGRAVAARCSTRAGRDSGRA